LFLEGQYDFQDAWKTEMKRVLEMNRLEHDKSRLGQPAKTLLQLRPHWRKYESFDQKAVDKYCKKILNPNPANAGVRSADVTYRVRGLGTRTASIEKPQENSILQNKEWSRRRVKRKVIIQQYPGQNVARWQRYKCSNAFAFHNLEDAKDALNFANLRPYWTYGLSHDKKKRETKDCWAGQVGKPDLVLEALYHDFKTGLVKKRIIITEVDGEDKTVQAGSGKRSAEKGRGRGRVGQAGADGGDGGDGGGGGGGLGVGAAAGEDFAFAIDTGMPAADGDDSGDDDEALEDEEDDSEEDNLPRGSDDDAGGGDDGDSDGEGDGDGGGGGGGGGGGDNDKKTDSESKHPIKLALKAMASVGVQQAIQPETYNIRSNFNTFLNKKLEAALSATTPLQMNTFEEVLKSLSKSDRAENMQLLRAIQLIHDMFVAHVQVAFFIFLQEVHHIRAQYVLSEDATELQKQHQDARLFDHFFFINFTGLNISSNLKFRSQLEPQVKTWLYDHGMFQLRPRIKFYDEQAEQTKWTDAPVVRGDNARSQLKTWSAKVAHRICH